VFLTYLLWYSIGRFFVEGLRTDSLAFYGPEWLASLLYALWSPLSLILGEAGAMAYGNIRMAQLISLVIVILVVLAMILRRALGYARQKYLDPIQREGYIAGAGE
jgi:phosphatidylglycerol:prolipoprotein diacylglycerol transferase